MPSKTHDSLSSQFRVMSPARKAVHLQMMVNMLNYVYRFPVGVLRTKFGNGCQQIVQ